MSYIEKYIEYLESECKDNNDALLEISFYKIKSAGEENLEDQLFSKLKYDLELDVLSYKVFVKKMKIGELFD